MAKNLGNFYALLPFPTLESLQIRKRPDAQVN